MPLDHQLNRGTAKVADARNLIVFTDLDGTLLDHETYSHAKALPALERLRELEIPLILASSKTAAEIVPLRAALGLSHCEAIVENGCGIIEAGEADEGSGETYHKIREILNGLPPALRSRYQGFSDWTAQEVSARTGLSLVEAANARKRQFSEPGLWLGNEKDRQEFVALISEKGLDVQQGGRFMTLSFGGNKAERVIEIANRYTAPDCEPFIIAFGDAGNDVAMIEQAHLGVIIPNPAHGGIPRLDGETTGRVIRAGSEGPAGWNQIITALLDQWQKSQERSIG